MNEIESGAVRMARLEPIYSKLVHAEDDLAGLIAYGLYKQAKLAFLANYREIRGIEPDDQAIESFCIGASTPGSVENFRRRAEAAVESTTLDAFQKALDTERQSYEKELASAIKKFTTPSFMHHVMVHALSAFVVWVAVLFLIFMALVYVKGLPGAVQSLTGWEIHRESQAAHESAPKPDKP